ncbi:MAG: HAMP domain-containing histidine kinase [candidate division KSB1 bacterium]|nr:HAMP domain-containing histidine kinase [candidate division KSB1 bacterium]
MQAAMGEISVDDGKLQQRLGKLEKEVQRLRRELRLKRRELEAKEEELLSHYYLVSHELKTPLISIRGFANLLQEFHAGDLPEEAQEYLQRMIQNVDQMERLINNLLLISRLRADEQEMELVNIADVVEEAIWEQQYLIQEKRATVTVAPFLPTVYCQRNLLVTVFSNLIGNALKYSRPGVPPEISVGYSPEEIFHKFWVRDNGIGIAPKDRPKLFKMFSRLGNKRGVPGSGLGLAIVKRIVEVHGGEIWVKSRYGRGSCFYFTLAKGQPAHHPTHKTERSSP